MRVFGRILRIEIKFEEIHPIMALRACLEAIKKLLQFNPLGFAVHCLCRRRKGEGGFVPRLV